MQAGLAAGKGRTDMRFVLLSCCIAVLIPFFECLGATPPITTPARPDVISPPPAEKTLPPSPPNIPSKTAEAGVLCPTANKEAMQFYNEARSLQDKEQFQEAEASYLKAIELDPNYCDAMDNVGLVLRKQGNLQQAIYWYNRSIAVKPDNPVAHQNLAAAYSIMGDAKKSLAEYDWLIQHESKNPEGYYGLGKTDLELGKTKDAIDALLKATELYHANGSPFISDAQYLLGIAYFLEDDCRKAKEYFELVYAHLAEEPDINYYLGLCYLDPAIENRELAKQYLQKAEQLGAKLPETVVQELRRVN